jgi:hypothetical protein
MVRMSAASIPAGGVGALPPKAHTTTEPASTTALDVKRSRRHVVTFPHHESDGSSGSPSTDLREWRESNPATEAHWSETDTGSMREYQ